MTEQEKQLLLKDLCARLPYKVRCKCVNGLGGGKTDKGVLKYIGNCNGVISNYYEDVPLHSGFVNNVFYPIENIKPYLRPMSSMTEEERLIYEQRLHDVGRSIDVIDADDVVSHIDWLLERHFDFRGLIPMGLALEAPEGMYNI